MTLDQLNSRWIQYKNIYKVDSPVLIEEVCFDAPRGVEASFDVTEMFSELYILHLSKRIHLYRSEYIDMLLCHEFTHLADFLMHPYSYNVIGKLYHYMNTWSEYHASRRCLGMVLSRAFAGQPDPDKPVIPQAFRDVSLRRLINDTLSQAGAALEEYRRTGHSPAYHIYFRLLMYLMGYISHFANASDILDYCLTYLKVDKDSHAALYQALQKGEAREIIPFFDKLMGELK